MDWRAPLVNPHASSSLCPKAGGIKETKNPCPLSPLSVLRGASRRTGALRAAACVCSATRWMSAAKVQRQKMRGGWKTEREGGRDAKKQKWEKNGNSVSSRLVSSRPEGKSTQSSEIKPGKSWAQLIQSIPANREPVVVRPYKINPAQDDSTQWGSVGFCSIESKRSVLPTQRHRLLTAAAL